MKIFGKRFFEFVFSKLGSNLNKKIDICFDIEVYGDSFKVELFYELPKTWYLQALRYTLKKDVNLPDTFRTDKRAFSFATPRLKSTLKKIEKDVQRDLKAFRIVTYKIKDMLFVVKDNVVETKIIVEGLCVS